jgi:hypothetical protein
MANLYRPRMFELDAAFAAAVAGDTIELGEGTYRTLGNFSAGPARRYCQLAAGVRLVGQGSARTVIRLAPEAREPTLASRPDRDTNVLWAGPGVSIAGITFDANMAECPDCHVGGLRFHGAYDLEDLHIVGLRGSWNNPSTLTREIEVFAISSQGDTGGSRVHRVAVYDVAPSAYVSGIFLGSTLDPSRRSRVTNCDVQLGSGNQFGFSANRSVDFAQCRSRGGRYGFYNDTGPTRDITLDGCDLEGSWAAVSVIAKATDGVRGPIRILRSHLLGARGVEVWDRTGQSIPADLLLDGCEVDADYLTTVSNAGPVRVQVRNSVVAARAKNFRSATSPRVLLSFNRKPGGTPGADTIPETVS